jgi:predicted RND superfamily exporter protein
MPVKDKLDLSRSRFLDRIVDNRRGLVAVILVVTAFMALQLPNLPTDYTIRSAIDTTSQAFKQYERFIETFGDEEFLLLALKPPGGFNSPETLAALERLTRKIRSLERVDEVMSIATLKIPGIKGDRLGSQSVIETLEGKPALPDPERLALLKKTFTSLEMLLSGDLNTAGVLIRIQDEWKFDTDTIRELMGLIRRASEDAMPKGTDFRLIGPPIVRQAIVKYNLQTGATFGVLCMVIVTAVSVYMFRSVTVTLISDLVLGFCVVWVLGLMSLLRIPLNSSTVLSFGFVPIVAVEILAHMVVRYHQFHKTTLNKESALKQTVRWLARPCFVCVATTAVGFGALMISSIPMVRQLGFIMSLGVIISYALAMILTPAFFSLMKSLDAPESSNLTPRVLDKVIACAERLIISHYRVFLGLGLAATVTLLFGAFFVKTDPQILRMMSETTPEMRDVRFVDQNLTPVHWLEVAVFTEPDGLRKTETWRKVEELERRLRLLPEVAGADSFAPVLRYFYTLLAPSESQKDQDIPEGLLVARLLSVFSVTPEGKRLVGRWVSPDYDATHVSVRIRNSPNAVISETIETIRAEAERTMGKVAKVEVTGDLAVWNAQTRDLIHDQITSLVLAAVLITVIMMIQMESAVLGLIALIPNIPPVAAVFGVMGWFGVALDNVTIFSATVGIGLAVDNTIHYLTQLQREASFNSKESIEYCVISAYRLTARQIIAWTAVILMAFGTLALSPFRPFQCFALLGFSALLFGMYGDLFFIESLVLSSRTVRRAILELMGETQGTGVKVER